MDASSRNKASHQFRYRRMNQAAACQSPQNAGLSAYGIRAGGIPATTGRETVKSSQQGGLMDFRLFSKKPEWSEFANETPLSNRWLS